MQSVVVVDTGIVNLKSVIRALAFVGASIHSTSDYKRVLAADRVILPGVGAFPSGMSELTASGLDDTLKEVALMGKPILGICLGMQMLLEFSEEHSRHAGLGLVEGSVVEIPSETGEINKRKIPHVGWSALSGSRKPPQWKNSCLENLAEGTFCYFSHSFMALPANADDVIATINYEDICIVSALQHENVMGIQFHPELSGPAGLRILETFLAM
jgi:glutamine amidotransferase